MELTADKDVTVTSCKDSITIAAKEEILLNVGGGAYIRMAGGNIEVHCPGTVSVKGAEHQMSGGTSMGKELNSVLQAKFEDRFRLVDEFTGAALPNRKYVIERSFGEKEYGTTDADGYTHTIKNNNQAETITIAIKE
ncbi:hypothetical protein GCM10011290_31560 [Vogesella alkaliphila]|uniref:DUF2345 domain-containing protein n=2 Tax=Vogesella alkaliphila TaxID=1193621 RepID=A0ABQ2Z2D4_9NEIS|nr:hypothetical protein GCM10011290_31560 [Vogesella alkaliphila]